MNLSKIIIKSDEKAALLNQNHDTLNFSTRIYFDESEKNDDIIVATVSFDLKTNKHLKNVNVIFTHHNEFKSFIMIVEKLIKHCKNSSNVYNKIYKVYFDN